MLLFSCFFVILLVRGVSKMGFGNSFYFHTFNLKIINWLTSRLKVRSKDFHIVLVTIWYQYQYPYVLNAHFLLITSSLTLISEIRMQCHVCNVFFKNQIMIIGVWMIGGMKIPSRLPVHFHFKLIDFDLNTPPSWVVKRWRSKEGFVTR